MDKLFRKRKLMENSFEGSPGGSSGTLNYGQQYGTPNSSTQTPSKFSSSDKTTDNFHPNTSSGSSATPTMKDRPDQVGNNQGMDGTNGSKNPIFTGIPGGKIVTDLPNTNKPESDDGKTDSLSNKADTKIMSPAGAADQSQANKPLDPTKQFDPQVDKIFKKKDTPSPDEIMSALQYELSNMTKKDKTIAKQIVLKNLKSDPHFYSRLKMLNISDEEMKINESTFKKTKKTIDEMVIKKHKNFVKIPTLDYILEDLRKKRYNH